MIAAIQASPNRFTMEQTRLMLQGFISARLTSNSGASPGQVHCVHCGVTTTIAPSFDEYGNDHQSKFPFQATCAVCARPVVQSHSLLAAAGLLAETVEVCPSCGTPHTPEAERYCVVCGLHFK